MIWTRLYRTPTDTLLAAADEDLLGKELREGKFRLKVSENFYKDILVEEQALEGLLSLCTIANLVGERSVGIAMDSGYISRENVIYIQVIPHAQFTTME